MDKLTYKPVKLKDGTAYVVFHGNTMVTVFDTEGMAKTYIDNMRNRIKRIINGVYA